MLFGKHQGRSDESILCKYRSRVCRPFRMYQRQVERTSRLDTCRNGRHLEALYNHLHSHAMIDPNVPAEGPDDGDAAPIGGIRAICVYIWIYIQCGLVYFISS